MKKVAAHSGCVFAYRYDLGDDWRHLIQVDHIGGNHPNYPGQALTESQRAKALVVALLCALLLLNLTGGWTEIPDCLPVVGTLDEVATAVVLLWPGWGGRE